MICFICNDCFKSSAQLIIHLKIFHNLTKDSEYECIKCNKKFQNLHSFRRHINNHDIQTATIQNEMPDRSSFSRCSTISDETRPDTLPVQSTVTTNSYTDSDVIIAENTIEGIMDLEPTIENPEVDGNNEFFSKMSSLIKILNESAIKFSLEMHNRSNFNRKDVVFIQEMIINNIVAPIISTVRLLNESVIKNAIKKPDIENVLKSISDPFSLCKTEYRLTSWLKSQDLLENPIDFIMNNETTQVLHLGQLKLEEKLSKGVVLPLKFYFKKIFEKGNNLQVCLENANSMSDNFISTFAQGGLWKTKSSNLNSQSVIPFLLYFDDLEINDPLGSHSDSVGAFYFSFPGLGSSKLENIFLGGFIKTSDLKKFGNSIATCNLIDEINSLYRDGIFVNQGDTTVHVHFLLGLVVGDNLGLNGLLDFTKSFNSNFFCRFCKCSKTECLSLYVEDSNKLRNAENYLQDVASENMSLTGINSNSIFNSIEKFHITENYSLDFMHIFPEGILHYDLGNILQYYIFNLKLFTLEDLNRRKKNFSYGEIEITNICNDIKLDHLKKRHFKMSSREMMTFANFLPLMIGDLVPDEDEVWKHLCRLLTLMDLLLSKHFDTAKLNYIKILIEKQLIDYKRLFSDHLKPKHHLLVHYASIIEKSGPPKEYWCYRFEAKHKEFKMYCRSMTSRKHICLSLVKKYQLKFANYLLSKQDDILSFDLKHTLSNNLDNIPTHLLSMHISYYSEIVYKGTLYKKYFILTRFILDEVHAYSIEQLSIDNNSKVTVVCVKLHLVVFSEHYHSYIVNDSLISTDLNFISIDDFSGPPINMIKISNGLNMLRLKEYY